MANELDEITGSVNENGRDINVIEKQIPVTITWKSTAFEIFLWIFIIPGLVFLYKKQKAKEYLAKLQQKIQAAASTIDNYLEQRVVVLENVVGLVEKSTTLDKETFSNIAALRSGNKADDTNRNELQNNVDSAFRSVYVAVERYPELKSQHIIADAMQQNSSLQKEITAAREEYNDVIYRWNAAIQVWPTKRIVAAKAGYTTRIPFSASKEMKENARKKFF